MGSSSRVFVERIERHRYLFLASVGTLLYLTCLGLRDLWFPNEPNVAQTALTMYLSGDWVVPRRMGAVWLDYPPLIYWAGALFSTMLGATSEVSLRLPSALGAIVLALVTCAMGSRWFGPSTGLWAGLVLLTFPQFVLQAVGYRPDMLFSLFIASGLLVYASGTGPEKRLPARVAGFALFGLAMLTKGPLGLLLPGLVLCLWHGARREWRSLAMLPFLALVSLALYLAWFIACAYQVGAGDILQELWKQNTARFTSGFRGHARPAYYYAVNIWHDMAPWSVLLPLALWWSWRRHTRSDSMQQLLLWWFGVFFVFLSIGATKRQLYLLPAYPAVALLLGQWIAAVVEGRAGFSGLHRRLATVAVVLAGSLPVLLGGILLSAAVGADLLVQRLTLNPSEAAVARSLQAPGLGIGLVSVAVGFWVLRARSYPDLPRALCRLAIGIVSIHFLVLSWFMPRFNPVKTYEPAGRWIAENVGSESVIGIAYPRRGRAKMAAFGYYSRRGVDLLDSKEEIEGFLRDHPGSAVLLAVAAAETIYGPGNAEWQLQVVKELTAGGDRYFVLR
ncbi:MAG: glycosyltransferase family 39 protein [Deltaproteobacteria bacterium]|nr:glycosyltransferase family 39 protein [Deltaproteobacteria bacterium]